MQVFGECFVVIGFFCKCICEHAYQSGILLGEYSVVEELEVSSGLAVLYFHLSC